MPTPYKSKYGGVPVDAGYVSKYGGVPVSSGPVAPPPPNSPLIHVNSAKWEAHRGVPLNSPHGQRDPSLLDYLPSASGLGGPGFKGVDAAFGTAADEVRALGIAATPAMLPSMVSNPMGWIKGLGAGIPTSWLLGKGGEAIGAPGTGKAIGDVAGFRVGNAASKVELPGLDSINPFNIRTAVTRAWNPAKADVQFPEVAPEAVSEVKTYGRPRSFTNEETIHAANDAIEHHQQLLDNWIQHAEGRGIEISGDRIVDAVRESIPYTDQLEYPDQVRSILQRYQTAYGGRMFKPSEMRTILGNKNAAAQALYSKAPAAQRIADITGSNPALEEAAAEGARGALYEGIDPDNFGAGPAEIQRRTGEIIKLRNAAEGRRNSVIAEKPLTPLGAVGNVAEGALNALGAPFHGGLKGALGEIGHPITGPTDALIHRIYANSPEATPLPQPYPYKPWDPARPVNLSQPWNPRQLAGPTPQLPLPGLEEYGSMGGIEPVHTTGSMPPEWQANIWKSMGGQKLLPPSSQQFSSSGVVVPDILGRPNQGQPYNAGLLGAGAQPQSFTQPPILTPPPTDTSFVHGVPAMYPTGPNPARALPPATTRISPMPGGTATNPTTTSSPLVSPQSPSPSVAAPPIAPVDPSGPVPLGWKTVWDAGSKSYRYVRK